MNLFLEIAAHQLDKAASHYRHGRDDLGNKWKAKAAKNIANAMEITRPIPLGDRLIMDAIEDNLYNLKV